MPDSSTSSNTPDELNFDTPANDAARLKRRSLEPRPASENKAPHAATPSQPTTAQKPNATPLYYTTGATASMKPTNIPSTPASQPAARSVTSAAQPAPRPAATGYTSPTAASSNPAASPQTTRPAPTSTGYTNPSAQTARPASSTASPASTSRPASSSPAPASPQASQAKPASSSATTSLSPAISSPTRPGTASEFRSNVERQSREQKSVGGLITIVVYALVAMFIMAGLLAGYGSYVIFKQIHEQSLTLADLDSRYSAENKTLSAQIKASNDSLTEALTQAQAQLSRQQELLTREQDSINRLITASDANASAWRQERQSRAAEEATLRLRMRNLEDQSRYTAH